jgi:hypothetical protein
MRYSVVIILSTMCGCAGTSLAYTAIRESPVPLRSRPAAQVEVFMTKPPERPHVELGIVESQQEPGSTDDAPDVIAKMRALAGQHGCDALVIIGRNDATSETMLAPGGGSRVYTLSGYRASCIAYLQAATPAPKTPPRAELPVACVPNATQACVGPGGCRGGQECTADGRAWTRCDCGPTPLPPTAAEQ